MNQQQKVTVNTWTVLCGPLPASVLSVGGGYMRCRWDPECVWNRGALMGWLWPLHIWTTVNKQLSVVASSISIWNQTHIHKPPKRAPGGGHHHQLFICSLLKNTFVRRPDNESERGCCEGSEGRRASEVGHRGGKSTVYPWDGSDWYTIRLIGRSESYVKLLLWKQKVFRVTVWCSSHSSPTWVLSDWKPVWFLFFKETVQLFSRTFQILFL